MNSTPSNYPRWHWRLLAVIALVASILACSLPLPGNQPAATQPSGAIPTIPPGSTAAPDAIMTMAAATVYAQIEGQLTAQAAPPEQPAAPAPGTVQPGATLATAVTAAVPASPEPGQPTTTAPVQSQPTGLVPQPSELAAPVEQPAVQPPFIQPAPGQLPDYSPPSPPAGFVSKPGTGFQIAGVNLPSCGSGVFAANFLIYNSSNHPLESLSLQFLDLPSGANLLGPVTNNTPFTWDDHACQAGGIDRLDPGQAAFVGNSLGSGSLSGQAIQAVLTLCGGNDLANPCYEKTVEFVVP